MTYTDRFLGLTDRSWFMVDDEFEIGRSGAANF